MQSRQPEIWASALITYLVALIAFVLRFVARRLIKSPLQYDDYIALAAFLFTTGFTVVNLYKLRFGFGLHLQDIHPHPNDVSYHYFRLLWIDSWFYTFGIGCSKLAVLALYLRIFGQSNIKIPIQILIVIVIGWIVARVIVIPLQCFPIQKFWDHSISGSCPVKTNYFFFGTTIPHLVMEVAIVVLPIWKVRQMNLRRPQKIALGGMFASGTIVCVASLVQLIEAFRLNTDSQDIWWTAAPQLMWSVVEVNLGHFSTSLPNLRPILNIVMGRKPDSSGRTRVVNGESGSMSAKAISMRPVSGKIRSDAYTEI